MFFKDDIIAAQATSPGKSAIAVIRMSGAGALKILRRCIPEFQSEIVPRRATLASFGEENREIDQVVFIYYRGPKSYTGEDLIEIHCHGGEYITRRILNSLCRNGARPAEPGEFTFRAFLNGKMDLTQAEAVSDLIESESEYARRNALNQLNGGLYKEIKEISDVLLSLIAELEVELEFPEEEPFEADYWGWGVRMRVAMKQIRSMVEKGDSGRAVREGFRVTIAGPPNSGKSTLLNTLTGEDRAIVHSKAGTTRDILREAVEIGGIKVWLTDTAGLRQVRDEVEQEGVNRAEREIGSADLIIYLFDLGAGLEDSSGKTPEKNCLFVGNKIDIHDGAGMECDLKISALRGDGLNELRDLIAKTALGKGIEGGVIANERHLVSLKHSLECMERAVEITKKEGETELIALELREAAKSLGDIIGEAVTEEVLEEIFSRFCIGK